MQTWNLNAGQEILEKEYSYENHGIEISFPLRGSMLFWNDLITTQLGLVALSYQPTRTKTHHFLFFFSFSFHRTHKLTLIEIYIDDG